MIKGSLASLFFLMLAATMGPASAQPKGWRHLPSITVVVAKVPDRLVQSLSDPALANPGVPMTVPAALGDLPGDIVVVLSDWDFISFAARFAGGSRRLVGIKGTGYEPFIFPNVARNVIAHELATLLA